MIPQKNMIYVNIFLNFTFLNFTRLECLCKYIFNIILYEYISQTIVLNVISMKLCIRAVE